MSSIESAPASIPATSEHTFNPAFAPLSVGTLNRSPTKTYSSESATPSRMSCSETMTSPTAMRS